MEARGNRLLLASAVAILAGAAVLWWDLFRDGVTFRGIALAALFSAVGVFWLLVPVRAGRAKGPDSVEGDPEA